jgi:hypothetical protein
VRRLIAALLLAVPCAASAQQKVPLVLDHIMVTLDSATFHDVRASPFFANSFSAVDSTQGGFDLFGRYNWLTLVGPESNAQTFICLASEHPEQWDQVKRTIEHGAGARHIDGAMQWSDRASFSQVDLDLAETRFCVRQFDVAAAKRMAQRDSLPDDNRTLARFLAPHFDRTKLFSALTGATLAIPVADIEKIVNALRPIGVSIVIEGEGAIIKLDGFTLHLVPSFVGAGVKQLQFALTRTAVGNPIYQFGQKSQLRFGPGPIAVWNFNWP